MIPMTRREAFVTAVGTSSIGTVMANGISLPQDQVTKDQEFVMAAGMTREEAECWKITAEAAGAFFALPKMHPMDEQEVAMAIHIIQNKLLSRPTYRKYLEAAKAGREPQLNK